MMTEKQHANSPDVNHKHYIDVLDSHNISVKCIQLLYDNSKFLKWKKWGHQMKITLGEMEKVATSLQ